MAERRQLPVEHGDDARLASDAGSCCRCGSRRARSRSRRPRGRCAPSHAISRFMSALSSVFEARYCLRPAIELSRDVAFGLAEIAESARAKIDRMQLRADARVVVHRLRRARRASASATLTPRDHASFDVIHHIERRADDRSRLRRAAARPAREIRPGNARRIRYSRSTRCAEGRSLPGGFLRRTNFFAGVLIRIGGIRLPALELPQRAGAAKSGSSRSR